MFYLFSFNIKYIYILASAQIKFTATLEPVLIIMEFPLKFWSLMTLNNLSCVNFRGYSIYAYKMNKMHGRKEYKIL